MGLFVKISFASMIGFLGLFATILFTMTGYQVGGMVCLGILLAVLLGCFIFKFSVDCTKVVLFYHALCGDDERSKEDWDDFLED